MSRFRLRAGPAGASVAAWIVLLAGAVWFGGVVPAPAAEEEPPALNPFGAVRQERDDAIPGYLELSDGTIHVGGIYLTRDKRLKVEDRSAGEAADVRQREIPFKAVQRIECEVRREWMEKEWRFKEAALNEKVYTGRTYPSRVYEHAITLKNGRKIVGPLAEIVYIQPYAELREGSLAESRVPEPLRFFLNKRNKGEIGTTLDALVYVKRIRLGADAVEEGKRKAREAEENRRKTASGKSGDSKAKSGEAGKRKAASDEDEERTTASDESDDASPTKEASREAEKAEDGEGKRKSEAGETSKRKAREKAKQPKQRTTRAATDP